MLKPEALNGEVKGSSLRPAPAEAAARPDHSFMKTDLVWV